MNLKVALHRSTAAVAAFSLALAGCGGGGDGNGTSVGSPSPAPTTPAPSGRLFADPEPVSLSVDDVQRVIAQAVGEARARNLPATIAVVDRVGNVLGVFNMNGARATLVTSAFVPFIGRNNDVPIDAQGLTNPPLIPAAAGAIAKAVTGAYLSSSGNAFSTRTASQIVQQHFPPSKITPGLESGPLFGVQFSSLPCSDLNARFNQGSGSGSVFVDPATGGQVATSAMIGPKRSPLGLAADSGGFPLYKNGVVVGGVGVMADGDYAFDPNQDDVDSDAEEFIALAAIQGFAPPETILANRISVDGSLLRFSDARVEALAPRQTDFAAINGTAGALVPVRGYTSATGAIVPGTAYGTPASGYERAPAGAFNSPDVYVLTNGAGVNRFPIRGGTDAAVVPAITATEARAILEEAFGVMAAGRAQIRQPLDSRIQVTLSLVDTNGAILGVIRSPDAPIFGTDVSLQKARSVNFFSHPSAGADLLANPDGDVAQFVQRVRAFLGDPNALTGTIAFTDRAIGNIARPYYPDGQVGRPPGPLSRPIEDFNPFATGLQVQLILQDLLAHVGFVLGASGETPQQCTRLPGPNRLKNGLQIFPGASPIYRNGVLVGGLGISGDGIDQDDMISFLGVHRGGLRVGTGIGHAPPAIRADRVIPPGTNTRLRYVNCPFAPFVGTSDQNVCEGI